MGSVWRDARSIADLGQNMAGWLKGEVPSWPGYLGSEFGEEETDGARHLVPTLIAANRAGFVTTCSQPGSDEVVDGVRWHQRAWVEGVVHDRSPLLGRLLKLQGQGFTVVRGWPKRQIVLTEVDGRHLTAIGGWKMRRNDIHTTWRGIGRQALREVRQHGAAIHIIDTAWGRDDRLWPALMGAVR